MAINWSIVEAIGTWFSGIITAGTLLFMYVQYHSDKKERLKKEEGDKLFEFILESIKGLEVAICIYKKNQRMVEQNMIMDEEQKRIAMDSMNGSKEALEAYRQSTESIIKDFFLRDHLRACVLDTKLNHLMYDLP